MITYLNVLDQYDCYYLLAHTSIDEDDRGSCHQFWGKVLEQKNEWK